MQNMTSNVALHAIFHFRNKDRVSRSSVKTFGRPTVNVTRLLLTCQRSITAANPSSPLEKIKLNIISLKLFWNEIVDI